MSSNSFSSVSTSLHGKLSTESSTDNEILEPNIIQKDINSDSCTEQMHNKSEDNINMENNITNNSNIDTDFLQLTLLNQNEEDKTPDSKFDIDYYTKDISDFKQVEEFEKLPIMTDGDNNFYACWRFNQNSFYNSNLINKMRFYAELKHPRLPILYGYDYIKENETIIEIRKIDFKPFPITIKYLLSLSKLQRFKIISQILDFLNYITRTNHSISFLSIFNICSCCFLDSESNIFFGDLSFIDVDNNVDRTLISIGNIISPMFACIPSISGEGIIDMPRFPEDLPVFWRKFLEICFFKKVNCCSLYSQFMIRPTDSINVNSLKDYVKSNLLEGTCDIIKENWKFEKLEIPTIDSGNEDLRSFLNNYESLKFFPATVKRDNRFKELRVELTEEGNYIFTDKYDDEIYELIPQFLKEIIVKHPMILPLKGFSYEHKKKGSYTNKIRFYREGNQTYTPIEFGVHNMEDFSDEQRIKWMKQLIEIVVFAIEKTNYGIRGDVFNLSAVLDSYDNIVFVNLKFLRDFPNEDIIMKNIKTYWWICHCFLYEKYLPNNMPITIKQIFTKERDERSVSDFLVVKKFLDNYDPSINYLKQDVMRYLDDYIVDREIEGHNCKIKIYKRKLFSDKKFKKLVLKRYNFAFTEKQKKVVMNFKNKEELIIETWTEENESFVLMKHVKANRLKDKIPYLDDEQKNFILIDLVEKFLPDIYEYRFYLSQTKHTKDINPLNWIEIYDLSVDNVYVDDENKIHFLDCCFVVAKTDDPQFPPGVKKLSTLSKEERDKINVFSFGIIAYELFGGVYDPNEDFKFKGFPSHIEEFVKACCIKDINQRAGIERCLKLLKKSQKSEKMQKLEESVPEFSRYFIVPSDLIPLLESSSKVHDIQKSTNKELVRLKFSYKIDDLINLIEAQSVRNILPLYGFTLEEDNIIILYEINGH